MNSKQAKQINLVQFLTGIGYKANKIKNNNTWYISPFRPNETKPSFKVDTNTNYWYDFGIGKGGTIIDFVMLLLHTDDISSVLKYIESNTNWTERNLTPLIKQVFSFQQQKEDIPKFETYISPIKDNLLFEYLKSRGISETYTSKLKQATIFRKDKHYVALAFENDNGGYELRNKYFKGCTSKDLSTIKVENVMPTYVFEGFFDFLSFFELAKKSSQEALDDIKKSNVIILNSVAFLDKAITKLKLHSDIRLFLDNDDAGATSTLKIIKALPQSQDFSDLYKPYKDLNEFLVKTNKSKLPAFTSHFISRCAIVRTETKVQTRNGNLAFTPEGRKSEETPLQKKLIKKEPQTTKQVPIKRQKRRGICR